MRLFLFICLSEHLAHLPVDPLELTEVDFREILRSDVRKVPGRQEVRREGTPDGQSNEINTSV